MVDKIQKKNGRVRAAIVASYYVVTRWVGGGSLTPFLEVQWDPLINNSVGVRPLLYFCFILLISHIYLFAVISHGSLLKASTGQGQRQVDRRAVRRGSGIN